jgi:hypothetical protein
MVSAWPLATRLGQITAFGPDHLGFSEEDRGADRADALEVLE